jgi:hypothetical protein
METYQEILELSPCWDMLDPLEQADLVVHLENVDKEIRHNEKRKNKVRRTGQAREIRAVV